MPGERPLLSGTWPCLSTCSWTLGNSFDLINFVNEKKKKRITSTWVPPLYSASSSGWDLTTVHRCNKPQSREGTVYHHLQTHSKTAWFYYTDFTKLHMVSQRAFEETRVTQLTKTRHQDKTWQNMFKKHGKTVLLPTPDLLKKLGWTHVSCPAAFNFAVEETIYIWQIYPELKPSFFGNSLTLYSSVMFFSANLTYLTINV